MVKNSTDHEDSNKWLSACKSNDSPTELMDHGEQQWFETSVGYQFNHLSSISSEPNIVNIILREYNFGNHFQFNTHKRK